MIQSMTGYGKSVTELPGKTLCIEIKSLNSKQADINLKIPYAYRELEMEIRNRIMQSLERGKIDCLIYFDHVDDSQLPSLNQAAIKNYFHQLKKVAGELYIDNDEQLLPIIMRFPEALKTDKQEVGEQETKILFAALDSTLAEVLKYRRSEGRNLGVDIDHRVKILLALLEEILPLEKERISRIRGRIGKNLEENLNITQIDPNRFEQEILYYLEKMDFSEEKARLKNHCQYFLEVMSKDETVGKSLLFISQEMGREINTLGAKANDAAIQRLVVGMKDELEKIREQLANVL